MIRALLAAILLLGLEGCSEETNPLGRLVKPWSSRDAAAFLSLSQIQLDKGDYKAALQSAEEAYRLAPTQARIATQLSYAHLAVAGLDLFQLAKTMIEKEGAEDKAAKDGQEGLAARLAAGSNASAQLASLADLVGLTEADYEAITLPGNRLGRLEGAPRSGPFAALPVLLPKTAHDARASSSEKIGHIDASISVLCPFMADDVKVLGAKGDIRHIDASCERGTLLETRASKASFVWAIAHLVEAVAFHQIVLYQPSGTVPNLQQRSTALGGVATAAGIAAYVEAVTDLAAIVDVVMPIEADRSQGSMLTAMFNDLETVSKTFSSMAGIPENLSGGIIRALDQLKQQRDKLSAKPNADGNSVVLKDQLTSGLATELKKQIESKQEAGQLSEKDRGDVCEAYKSISSEALSLCIGS